jgi:succinate-semialdehyde dehydrogenase / glutarate-semialdehyde dehydrogenase
MKLADPTLLKDKCLVDGKWVGEGVDAIRNPATGALIAKVPRFGHAEAVRSIEAAARAFGPWAKALP